MIGENGISFTPVESGKYAVEITENSCTYTSACVSVNGVGLENISSNSGFSIHPNPTSGHIIISTINKQQAFSWNLYNSNGQLIDNSGSKDLFDEGELNINNSSGIYFIEIISKEQIVFFKVVKN